jgi:ABC-type antimicrobial peptide transport system permease subunit
MLGAVSPQRATAMTLAGSAIIALILAVVGTFGVLAYTVAQRTREIGVRMALGASAGAVERLVLRTAAVLAVWGIALGLVGAVAMGRGMRAILYDTSTADPLVLAGTAVALGAAALCAGWLPARRAARVDPIEALRRE